MGSRRHGDILCRKPYEAVSFCPASKRLLRAFVCGLYGDGVPIRQIEEITGYKAVNYLIANRVKKKRGRGNFKGIVGIDPASCLVVASYFPIKSAKNDGYSPQAISMLSGTQKTYKGLLWKISTRNEVMKK